MHEALAKFYDLEMSPETEASILRLNLLNLFHAAWAKQNKVITSLGLAHETIERFYRESVNMLYGWFYRFMEKASLDIDKPQTEVKLFSNKRKLMGIIDAIYRHGGKAVLIDYKTSARDDLTKEIRVQMGLYALLYLDKYGKVPDVVGVDFLKTGTKKFIKPTKHLIEFAARLCERIHEKIKPDNKEDYPCTCGGRCERDFEPKNATPPNT